MTEIPWRGIGLIAAVLATAAIIVVTLVSNGREEPGEGPPAAVPASETTADEPASDGGGDEELGGPDVGLEDGSETDVQDSEEAAVSAATVWVDHSLSAQEWRAQAEPLFTETAWPNYDMPAPERITPTRVTGAPEPLDVSVETADYLVPTDAGDLEVGLVKEGETWLVAYIDKDL